MARYEIDIDDNLLRDSSGNEYEPVKCDRAVDGDWFLDNDGLVRQWRMIDPTDTPRIIVRPVAYRGAEWLSRVAARKPGGVFAFRGERYAVRRETGHQFCVRIFPIDCARRWAGLGRAWADLHECFDGHADELCDAAVTWLLEPETDDE